MAELQLHTGTCAVGGQGSLWAKAGTQAHWTLSTTPCGCCCSPTLQMRKLRLGELRRLLRVTRLGLNASHSSPKALATLPAWHGLALAPGPEGLSEPRLHARVGRPLAVEP